MNKKIDKIMDRLKDGKLPTTPSDWLVVLRLLAVSAWQDFRWHCWQKWVYRRRLSKTDPKALMQSLRANGYQEWTDGNKTVFWKGEKRFTITTTEEGPNNLDQP